MYVRTNRYGVYMRYPGSLNFYNIYPSGVFEIDENYRKVRQLSPTEDTVNSFDPLGGVEAVLSYFNLLNPKQEGISFTEKNGRGIFYFDNAEGKDNVLVSIEFNESDLIIDTKLQILNTVSDTTLEGINEYLDKRYSVKLTQSRDTLEGRGNIFEKETIYVFNTQDNTLLEIPNIPNKQVVRNVDKNFIEIDLLGGTTMEIGVLNSLEDISK